MVVNLVQSLLIICFLGIACLQRAPATQVAIAVIIVAVLVNTYVWVPDSIAQDRYNFFIWYKNAWNTGFDLVDPGFSLALRFIPQGFDLQQFSFAFALMFFSFILVFYSVAMKQLRIEYGAIGLFMAFLLLDRYFLTLSYNNTRSSLAGVIFCFALLSKHWPTRIAFILASFSFHLANAALLLLIFVGAYYLRFTNVLKLLSLVLGAAFVIKMLYDFRLFDIMQLDSILYRMEDTRFVRGFAVASDETTTSLLFQFTLALVIPVCVVALKARNIEGRVDGGGFARLFAWDKSHDGKALTTRFVLMSVSAFFLNYPEFLLSQRILIAPLLLLPFLLDRKSLLGILFIKSAIFIFFVFPRILNVA